MKVCFNTHADNANKSELMPSGYPWTTYEVEDDFICPEGFNELSLEAFEAYKASFDLTAYNELVALQNSNNSEPCATCGRPY